MGQCEIEKELEKGEIAKKTDKENEMDERQDEVGLSIRSHQWNQLC